MTDSGESPYFLKITNREIYEQLKENTEAVGILTERVDTVLKDNVDIKKEYHNRIRQLELRSYTILAGCISTLAIALKTGVM